MHTYRHTRSTPTTRPTESRPTESRRTGSRRTARRRTGTALIALGAACALLLTGCGNSGDGGNSSSYDRGGNGGKADGFPAPAPEGTGPREQREGDEESEDIAPTPEDHLSTFALDVDTASYGYARRTLADGSLPDPSTVRPEEFVNSFRQDYERPDGDGFSVTVDGARTTGEDGPWSLVRVGLATRAAGGDRERPPAALTFVIDVSGSMAEPGRLDLAQDALRTMTNRLRDDDSVAIVTFSDEAETVLPMTRLDEDRDEILDAVDSLEPTDSTNLAAGVETGYETAVEGLRKGATNRVVLLSDALANTGATDADTILERIAGERREHGITLFGVGVGSDYGDDLMEQLADRGDGHTTYVSTEEEAEEVFCEELPRHVDLTARDAKVQVSFDPATVEEFRLIGYDNRQVADEDFRDDRVDGGEVGPGHTVTALYAVRTEDGTDAGHLATATVRWLDPDTRTPHEESAGLEASEVHSGLWTSAPYGLQVAAVAAYFADALRQTDGRWTDLPARPSLNRLGDRADDLARDREDKDLRALAEAIRTAENLMG
ncbi:MULTISPECIES: vWA domain-containing protein [Streptomyces]|uniref:von Willebrand factor type A domain-containing protein n=1 Tax=Streptomyces caniscabiei TaxID=2746961 RepID=A0ABU4MW33_9ACTN|nr:MULTISPECIES: VWA domain-containing protein [Streptomyces]MBE4739452.1 von Willebrand factor type A domain-containing protein [Streptomyces caniscabiei]MBE4759974.1 von Willebrand factor type A domain-containing protein [Streptomyces caniscabiei]MBE4772684.1 von Willebrand factor type A domain-containing protein [Streptomyces caniscabiei]MBE4784614.1 von Willebrand factor type A domain-containing protein [Streptomyces caniscabiei]MBE4798142.1 von Willebrand factor type A domain-containing p